MLTISELSLGILFQSY